jgi:hypothetical protein
MQSNGIGKVGMHELRDSNSIWRIYLPIDVDRDQYVKTCYLTGTVSLTNENAEFKHRVKIGKMALQLVSFPLNSKSFGSEVLCASMSYSGKLYVVDVYTSSSEFNDQDENQYRFEKNDNKGGYAEVRVDGSGKILMTVDGENITEICISVTNKDRSGSLKINVNGEIMIINDGKTTVQSSQDITLEQYDGNSENEKTLINIIKDQIKIVSKKILLNEGDEPVLLGKKTVDLLTKLLDFLGNESAGPYPLLGKANYTKLKNDLEALKSELSFVK